MLTDACIMVVVARTTTGYDADDARHNGANIACFIYISGKKFGITPNPKRDGVHNENDI